MKPPVGSQPSVQIRPFRVDDYPAVTTLFNAVYADYPFSEEEVRHDDARYEGTHLVLKRLVAETPAWIAF